MITNYCNNYLLRCMTKANRALHPNRSLADGLRAWLHALGRLGRWVVSDVWVSYVSVPFPGWGLLPRGSCASQNST